MKKNVAWIFGTLMIAAAGVLSGCGGSSQVQQPPPNHISMWTWVSGSNLRDQPGVYGTKGSASASNVPGARQFPASWSDKSGNLWLFGGNGLDSTGPCCYLNDLWKFDGSNWTWVSGSDIGNQSGVYGTKGTASPSNVPGGRPGSVTWIDNSGNLWLFGGFGYDSTTTFGELNDLWKFDGTNWTWISGSDVKNQAGVYGTKGTASPSNVPGSRNDSVSWIDSSGNLWLLGGFGLDSTGTSGYLNDLWKFDGMNWTWVSGSDVVYQTGVYGTKGTPSPSNVPGARASAISWTDKSGNLWVFGGYGADSTPTNVELNDLWKFDGTNWTWVSGSNVGSEAGVYGTKCAASPSNVPGARVYPVSWTDGSGNLWLFGGAGFDSMGQYGALNDLWKFDGSDWTWVSGSDARRQSGVYGTQGTPSQSNIPGGRLGFVSWSDKKGNLWLFGGGGYDSTGAFAFLNDLWQFEP